MSAATPNPEFSWYVTQRWQQYEGEARANLLRIIAVGTFYLIHLWNYFSSQGQMPNWGVLQVAEEGTVDRRFHLMVTFLALAWIMLAAGVHLALRDRVFPRWLPTATTLADVLFLTSVLSIASGPRSPLVVGYFLILAMATLRLSLPLIRVATVATVVGYLCVLGRAKWPATFGGPTDVDLTVPRYYQLMVMAALALTGIILGQVIRRVQTLLQTALQRGKP